MSDIDTEWARTLEEMRLPMPDGSPRRVWRAYDDEPIEDGLQLFDRNAGNCWRGENGLWSSIYGDDGHLPWREFVTRRGPLAECDPDCDDLTDYDGPALEDYSSWTQVYPLEHNPELMAQAWHDVTCPEGPDCRDRLLHSMGQVLANSGVLARFCERYDEVRQDKQWKALR